MRLRNAQVIWTVYFDSTLKRREGRRLPIEVCVPQPTLLELEEACRIVGLKVLESRLARYPRIWWKSAGYVAVEREREKREVIKRVAKGIREFRSARGGGRRRGRER